MAGDYVAMTRPLLIALSLLAFDILTDWQLDAQEAHRQKLTYYEAVYKLSNNKMSNN